MKPIAIIPARGGSKRIPRKNIADMNGRPIIAYTIATCLKSSLFSQIIVSTDSEEIARIAIEYGADVDERPRALGDDRVPASTVCHELLDRRFNKGSSIEWFCLVYPTAAFLDAIDLCKSADQRWDFDAVLGVSSFPVHPYKALTEIDGLMAPIWPELNSQQSQNFPPVYGSNGTFCWVRTATFMDNPTFYPRRLGGYTVPYERAIDIDTPDDLERARTMMRVRALKK